MHIFKTKLLLFFLLCFTPLALYAVPKTLQSITLQLQWKDQFEFAGFYAAKEKGFYNEVGLDVTFKPFAPSHDIIDEVLDGHAEYGLVSSALISRYLKGAPLIFVANFFKYSPLLLVSQEPYTLPSDLKGKKVMGVSNEIKSENIMLMFKKFNMSQKDFLTVSPNFNIQDFINKKIDAMTVYATNEIFELVKSKIKFNVINPSAYGIPSYDLNLFTTQEELKQHPQRVADFRAASIKGWEYALLHQDEIIKLIMEKYNSQYKSYDALKYEATQIQNIMLPSLMPLGSVDPLKVELIAENFMELGLAPLNKNINLNKFIYHAPPKNLKLTLEEKNYLQSKDTITYCSDPLWMPFSKIEDNKHKGIDAGFMKLFSQKLKHTMELLPTKTWNDSIEKVKSNQCDILTLVMDTPQRKEHMSFTKPIISSPLAIATTIEKRFTEDINTLENKRIGIVKDYAYKELLSYKYPYLDVIEVSNIQVGLAKVENGELYGFVDNLTVLGYYIADSHLGAIKISAKIDMNIELAYALNKENKILLSIINKTIDTIDEGSKQDIINRWSKVQSKDEKYYYYLFAKIFFILFLFLLPFFYHYKKVKQQNTELERYSYKDALSKLYNRRYMDNYIKEIYQDKRHKPFSLILLDIDNFKNVNDTYGHHYGDEIIMEISKILKDNIREEDIVSRWGGEEFLIFVPHTVKNDALELAERLLLIIQNTMKKENGLEVTCSFGVAKYFDSTNLTNTYLEKVDKALYQAKEAGKNCVKVY